MAFFRYYSIRLGPGQLVFQAEAGAALFWDGEPGDSDAQMAPYFSGGLEAGYRLVFGRWHIERYIRTGYPVLFGAGIGAGVSF
jgi:hypothetical protein